MTTTSGAAIQRYKIGYHSDEWGQRSSTPSGIPDASGSLVRYADHVTALAAGKATAAQAGEYPALVCDYCGALTPDPWHSSGMLHGKMSKHIHSCDACAARGAAQAQGAAEEIDKALNVYAQAFAARVNGWTRQNGDDLPGARSALFAAIHAYAQASTRPTTSPQADSVQEDVARLDFLIEQRAYVVSDPDACPGHWLRWARPDGSTWVQVDEHPTPRAAIDAARKQGARWQSAGRALTLHI